MRRSCALLALAVATPAAAHRLDYADVLSPAPRLGYATLEIAEAPPPPVPFSAPAGPGGESGRVRSFFGDRFEIVPESDSYAWDISGEIGGPKHRLWLATAGSGTFGEGLDYVEGQVLYSHPVLDAGLALQAGIRRDFVRPHRTYAVLGMQGNATSPLYLGLFGFLSTQGEVTGRAYAYYDWEPAPRVVLQPYAGLSASAEDIPALGLGRGLNSAELGLRLRYRIAEPFAPYVGLRYDRLLGRTADLAREAGDDVDAMAFLLGFRSYF
ncbi:MAG TPA: copper resistance protein B [Allosphingosinicella sp.]|nr:copper resistance protein B [Allosphingosinicella sp.]